MDERTLLKYLKEVLEPFEKDFTFSVKFKKETSCLIWNKKNDRIRVGNNRKKKSLQKIVYENFHRRNAPRILKQKCCLRKKNGYCLNPRHLLSDSGPFAKVNYRVLFFEDKKRMKNYDYEMIEEHIFSELITRQKNRRLIHTANTNRENEIIQEKIKDPGG